MITAMTMESIQMACQQRYESNEKRIVAIVIARYDIFNCRQMIQENYTFWHYWTGKALDFFWLGYGSYNFHLQRCQHFVGNYDNEPNVYFDTEVFCTEIKNLEKILNVELNDPIGILLCNYREGLLHLNESAYINIGSLMLEQNQYKLRDFTASLIKACKKKHNVTDVIWKLRLKKASYGLLDMKLSNFVSDGIRVLFRYFFGFMIEKL